MSELSSGLVLLLGCICCLWAAADGNTGLSSFPLIPHRSQQAMRRRLSTANPNNKDRPHQYHRRTRSDEDTMQVGALYQGYGTHYVDLWVGTPPQRQTVIVDTGSGMTGFPCSTCIDCGQGYHVDRRFLEDKSTTFQKVPCSKCRSGRCHNKREANANCSMSMFFKEGSSWTAFEAQDLVYMGGPHDYALLEEPNDDETSLLDPQRAVAFTFDMRFGCQTTMTGLFKTQLADGIMGMDASPRSTLWSQVYANEVIDRKAFALCFTKQPVAETSGTEAGAMTLGGFNELFHKTPMVFARTNAGTGSNYRFFDVHVRKVYLQRGGSSDQVKVGMGANALRLEVSEDALNQGGVIVDSGTTSTYFHHAIAIAFNNAFEEMTGMKYSYKPMNLTKDELNELPTVLFQLAGDVAFNQGLFRHLDQVAGLAKTLDPKHPYDVVVAFPPSHYMELDERRGTYSAQFYMKEGGGSVLGANVMMGHDVFFDVDNGRIGWAESDCDYASAVAKAGLDSRAADDAVLEEQDGVVPWVLTTCSTQVCYGMIATIMFLMFSVGVCCGCLWYQSSSKYINAPSLEITPISDPSCCDQTEQERLVPRGVTNLRDDENTAEPL